VDRPAWIAECWTRHCKPVSRAAGHCPRDRRAEDGCIPERYPMNQLETPDYAARTVLNLLDSDAMLIL